jgi:hypothetical protein
MSTIASGLFSLTFAVALGAGVCVNWHSVHPSYRQPFLMHVKFTASIITASSDVALKQLFEIEISDVSLVLKPRNGSPRAKQQCEITTVPVSSSKKSNP